jgi:ribonucleoside-diphosphate reductase alpha chain
MDKGITSTAQEVLEKRYFLDGESTWDQLATRVANHFSSSEKEEQDFKQVLSTCDFLLNSPALMNAGTEIESYSACYTLPVEDNMASIFKYYSDAALISKSGGGVGANFSHLRAKGAPIGKGLGRSSGPISFMKVQNEATEAVAQGGRRKGANMMILDCDHPDIWEFIKAKDTDGVLTNANLSVRISDRFMLSALNGDPSANAEDAYNVELWRELCERAWSSAEPGVLFGDTIERGNTVPHLGKLEQTNPCGIRDLQL